MVIKKEEAVRVKGVERGAERGRATGEERRIWRWKEKEANEEVEGKKE